MILTRLPNVLLIWGGLLVLLVQSDLRAQNLPMDRFCDIYGDNAVQRVDKIIRLFKLSLRPAEQLNGETTCSNGETFTLRNSCVGALRVGIFSLSDPNSANLPSKSTRLFHLYTAASGPRKPLLCNPPTP